MALWTPANISTAVWLDAADTSTITLNESTVLQWSDKSGNSRHVSQTTVSLQPTYRTAVLNGLNGVDFFSNKGLVAATSNPVVQFVATVIKSQNATWASYHAMFDSRSTATRIGSLRSAGGVSFYASIPAETASAAWENGTGISPGLGPFSAINLPQIIEFTVAPGRGNPMNGITVGNFDNQPSGGSGMQYEIIALSAVPSPEDRQRIEGYLAWKWGLQANLQVNHPYRNAAPTTNIVVPVTVPNAPNGARYRVWNTTRNAEIANAIVSGGSGISTTFIADDESVPHVQGDSVTVDIAYPVSTTAYLPSRILGQAVTTGVSGFVSQINDEVYNFHGINGSAITKFSADFAQDDIEVAIAENFVGAELYAFYVYMLLTESGIREWLGAITAIDNANFRINVSILSLRFDNQTSVEVWQTDNVRVFRSDNARPVRHPTTGGGGIDLNWRSQVYTTIVSTASPVITGDISQVPAAVQSGMTAQGYTSARAVTLSTALTTSKFLALK